MFNIEQNSGILRRVDELMSSFMRSTAKILTSLALFLGGIIAGGILFSWLMDRKLEEFRLSSQIGGRSIPVASTGFAGGAPGTEEQGNDFIYAAGQITESVVFVNTIVSAPANDGFHFFGTPEKSRANGSGVILAEEGYIITNNHVVETAEEIRVTLNDRREFEARIVARDPNTDLAVLKIEAPDLKPVKMGNSDDVKIGQWVLAVGNPFNLTSTVTAGIVSAKARNIGILRRSAEYSIESFIQTDAAVNPGNSGGALVNLNGELIGINTAIATETGFYAGYSFAIPSNLVRKVVSDLIAFGVVQRGFIGVSIADVTSEMAKSKGLKSAEGVYVSGISANGAAKEAGIREGDIIIAIDGETTRTSSELQEKIVNNHKPGDKVKVTVLRDGEEKNFEVRLKNQDGKADLLASKENTGIEFSEDGLGATLKSADKNLLQELGVSGGVAVTRLKSNGLFARIGMEEGFIITRVDRKPVFSPKEFYEVISRARGGAFIEGYKPNGRKSYFKIGAE
jgi:Do/DeqQ family serine protease